MEILRDAVPKLTIQIFVGTFYMPREVRAAVLGLSRVTLTGGFGPGTSVPQLPSRGAVSCL